MATIERRALLALAAVLGTGVRAAPASSSQLLDQRVDSAAGPVDFKLYLPAGYTTAEGDERRYPLLLLLHGRGDRMVAWTRIAPLLDRLIAAGMVPPLVAVMPDAPWSHRGGYYVDSAHADGSPIETALIRDLLPQVQARWRTRTDRAGRIVGGYSMGGYGALRYALAWPELFGAALVLSPAVYTPLPPQGSSAREFGGFGRGPELFVDEIYRRLNYPALLPGLVERGQALRLFIAAGDAEYKNPDPAEAMHDIDMEAHLLFARLSRTPKCETALRILAGGHDWPVWQPAFHEGLLWVAKRLGW